MLDEVYSTFVNVWLLFSFAMLMIIHHVHFHLHARPSCPSPNPSCRSQSVMPIPILFYMAKRMAMLDKKDWDRDFAGSVCCAVYFGHIFPPPTRPILAINSSFESS